MFGLFGKKKVLTDEQQAIFQRQQNDIYPLIGGELIALTPEHWKSAMLELSTGENGIRHSVSSDEGHKDVVVASMQLFEHTRQLELLFKQYGCMWKVARFRIWQDENQAWKFGVDYEYPA